MQKECVALQDQGDQMLLKKNLLEWPAAGEGLLQKDLLAWSQMLLQEESERDALLFSSPGAQCCCCKLLLQKLCQKDKDVLEALVELPAAVRSCCGGSFCGGDLLVRSWLQLVGDLVEPPAAGCCCCCWKVLLAGSRMLLQKGQVTSHDQLVLATCVNPAIP